MQLKVAQTQSPVELSLLPNPSNGAESSAEEWPSFEELYERYFPRLYAYLSYRLNNQQDTEDLVAETFLKAVKGLPSFKWEHQHSFAAWLFRIAHNTLASFQRDRQHWQERVASVPLESAEDLPVPESQLPEEQLLRQEQIRLVRRMLESLAPRQQEVLKLKFFGELRNQEIAAVLELDERSVSAYLHRGLEELQRRYLPAQTVQPFLNTPASPTTLPKPKRGFAMPHQPEHSSNWLPGAKPPANPSQPEGIVQPQGWLEGIGSDAILLQDSAANFILAWFSAYLQKAVPQPNETFRLHLKAYLRTQLTAR
jgi:RNA polymerase sigma-70 factor (ECF subfamily)